MLFLTCNSDFKIHLSGECGNVVELDMNILCGYSSLCVFKCRFLFSFSYKCMKSLDNFLVVEVCECPSFLVCYLVLLLFGFSFNLGSALHRKWKSRYNLICHEL